MCIGSNSNAIGTGKAVGIAIALTAAVMVVVGVVIGSLATYCAMKRTIATTLQQGGATGGQVYEEVSHSKPMEKIEMGENVAYGPI